MVGAMDIHVVTLLPELVRPVAEYGVTGRAATRGLMALRTWNPRDYATDRHATVDDRPYGGGPGMVMKVEPLRSAIRAARAAAPTGTPVSFLSPQGRRLDQNSVNELAQRPALILVAGRYEGVDERLLEAEVDEEWSIGDYVLSGGEPAAVVMIDAITRLLPEVLGDPESSQQDSFMAGLLDCPHYTRPEEMDGRRVPQLLLRGDHAAIRRWRLKQSLGRTWERRPDLLRGRELAAEERELLDEYRRERDGGDGNR